MRRVSLAGRQAEGQVRGTQQKVSQGSYEAGNEGRGPCPVMRCEALCIAALPMQHLLYARDGQLQAQQTQPIQ